MFRVLDLGFRVYDLVLKVMESVVAKVLQGPEQLPISC